jgi:signal transduction histidine kinase
MMDKLRMRTTLLIPLFALSFGCSLIGLLVIRTIVQRQIRASLVSDLQNSVKTYQNLQRRRRELLLRESALLADLPTLKALMTAPDVRTIEDGGAEFWQVSGGDFFALLDQSGKLVASYNRGTSLSRRQEEQKLGWALESQDEPVLLALDGRLFEVSTRPLLFGDRESGSRLGYIAVGYALDEQVAREVSDASDAEVAFVSDDKVVASTLPPNLLVQALANRLWSSFGQSREVRLGGEKYLTAWVELSTANNENASEQMSRLVVLKSFAEASQLLREVNRWVLMLVLLTLAAGSFVFLSISRTLTRPLEVLVGGTRALAQGNFNYRLSEDGVEEIRELSRAFDHMRIELRRTQSELIDSERLATIGRMASSISHDLRHYLSAMYANAEFMSEEKNSQTEREDLLQEVRTAVQGMTDLLDSLLLFTQTGRAIRPEYQSIDSIVENAVKMVRSHPASRDVKLLMSGPGPVMSWIDGKKLGRAIYNLLLNACQAARRGNSSPSAILRLLEDEHTIRITVADNGPGVPEAMRESIFLPFVSEGRESGVGLGLTLAQQIAHEHGGRVTLEITADNLTVFTITLPKSALEMLGNAAERKPERTIAPTFE